MKGCLYTISTIVALVMCVSIVSAMHGHFANHFDEVDRAARNRAAEASWQRQVAETAASEKRRAQEARVNHEKRLAWQRAHPIEYRRQLARQRADARRAELARREAATRAELRQKAQAIEQKRQAQVAAAAAAKQAEADRLAHDPKRQFLATVDESISGAAIAGNPYKFVGEAVDIHCVVEDIPDRSFFNASCGTDSDGLPAILVIKTDDTSDLSKGQSLRILGTVEDPMEGTNAMGGSRNFPTVKAEYME